MLGQLNQNKFPFYFIYKKYKLYHCGMSLIKLGRKPEQGDGVYCVEQLEKNLQISFFQSGTRTL